jgi:hypothetical protein
MLVCGARCHEGPDFLGPLERWGSTAWSGAEEGEDGQHAAAPPQQARDDGGVDRRLAVHDAAQGVHHDGDAEYALLGE